MPAETRFNGCLVLLAFALAAAPAAAQDVLKSREPPAIGDKAPPLALDNLQGERITLADQLKQGPVVLMVLRGFPGYQCPICNRQVGQYITDSDQIRGSKASVIMVYPGPSQGLKLHANEFVTGKTLPEGYHFVIDPDFQFVTSWGLRWDAPRETAYPSTFVIDSSGTVRFAKVSRTHGDRAPVADVVGALRMLPIK